MVPADKLHPTNKTEKTGEIAWLGLVAYIVTYDIIAIKTNRPTLSAAFHKTSQTKLIQPLLVSFWFYLTAHLFQWIPKRYDIFRK